MDKSKWGKDGQRNELRTMGRYYTVVGPDPGGGSTPIWVGPDPKYVAGPTFPMRCLIGPSYKQIPEIDPPRVHRTWKMCLLKEFCL